ncbi:hypothetical protein DEI81_10645 [Curtobacterium sp. MCBD17_013]|nr:hypothetical protein DEI81_10645 [Curtobacterium sp. MCBD17_013]
MAMTDAAPPDDPAVLALEPDQLDGHSVDELVDYLDRGMEPPDPAIDDSPACQNALAAIARLRAVSTALLEEEGRVASDRDDSWVGNVIAAITTEAQAGRDVPLAPTAPTEHAALTEGAIRALVRRAADGVDGLVVGRCSLVGDVTELDAPVTVSVTASLVWGRSVPTAVTDLRRAVGRELAAHTELRVAGIDVVVRDVHVPRDGQEADR